MKDFLLLVLAVSCAGCASVDPASTPAPPAIEARTVDAAGHGEPNGSSADPDFMGDLDVSSEPAYGSQQWPVTIGGYLSGDGHRWSKQYFASLLGPNGEPTTYERVGSCCGFKVDDEKLLADGIETGFLDVYEVRVGNRPPVRIYVSLYHEYRIHVPPGFTPRRRPEAATKP